MIEGKNGSNSLFCAYTYTNLEFRSLFPFEVVVDLLDRQIKSRILSMRDRIGSPGQHFWPQ